MTDPVESVLTADTRPDPALLLAAVTSVNSSARTMPKILTSEARTSDNCLSYNELRSFQNLEPPPSIALRVNRQNFSRLVQSTTKLMEFANTLWLVARAMAWRAKCLY